eukprot:GHVS01025736.1.p1 GENE.GHVS01025736.1~~GHVS01025736.1.p1  ORF type:complete len:109 (-),score=12.31 GHVS01025736.1:124-450(-)
MFFRKQLVHYVYTTRLNCCKTYLCLSISVPTNSPHTNTTIPTREVVEGIRDNSRHTLHCSLSHSCLHTLKQSMTWTAKRGKHCCVCSLFGATMVSTETLRLTERVCQT